MANPNPEAIIPPWLENLITMQFFNDCNIHGIGDPNASASKCNMFCLVCYNVQAFCSLCRRSEEHNGHRFLQVRRLEKHNVLRYSEMKDDMDIRDVQTYSAEEFVYLNERPMARNSNAVLVCRNCRRPLKYGYRFCSLGCKFAVLTRNVNAEEEEHQEEEEDNTMVAPRWLENLLNVQFPEQCSTHVIMFCFDCNNGVAYCSNCRRGDEHNGHQVLQIKRFWNRGEYAVSASAIPPELSANVHICKNGDDDDDVVFLNPSTLLPFQFIPGESACEVCKRTVNDEDARFCSLCCKLETIRRRNANNA